MTLTVLATFVLGMAWGAGCYLIGWCAIAGISVLRRRYRVNREAYQVYRRGGL